MRYYVIDKETNKKAYLRMRDMNTRADICYKYKTNQLIIKDIGYRVSEIFAEATREASWMGILFGKLDPVRCD